MITQLLETLESVVRERDGQSIAATHSEWVWDWFSRDAEKIELTPWRGGAPAEAECVSDRSEIAGRSGSEPNAASPRQLCGYNGKIHLSRQKVIPMTSITIDEARAKLSELLAGLAPGEEVVITKDNQPVGRLVGCAEPPRRQLGTMKGTVTYMAPDFDAPFGQPVPGHCKGMLTINSEHDNR